MLSARTMIVTCYRISYQINGTSLLLHMNIHNPYTRDKIGEILSLRTIFLRKDITCFTNPTVVLVQIVEF